MDYVRRAGPEADQRSEQVRNVARVAFRDDLREEKRLVILFSEINATQLGQILAKFPILAKPLMILCNVAERALERDLGLKNMNSYAPRFTGDTAKVIAGYLKPFLPP